MSQSGKEKAAFNLQAAQAWGQPPCGPVKSPPARSGGGELGANEVTEGTPEAAHCPWR